MCNMGLKIIIMVKLASGGRRAIRDPRPAKPAKMRRYRARNLRPLDATTHSLGRCCAVPFISDYRLPPLAQYWPTEEKA